MLYIVTYFYFTQLSNPTTDYVLLFLLFRKNNEVNNTLVFSSKMLVIIFGRKPHITKII
jgi:hypothetical protein